MAEMSKTFRICDLCGEEIKNWSPNGSAIIDYMWENQVWSVGDDLKDVCKQCCITLSAAQRMGMVEFLIGYEQLYHGPGRMEVTEGDFGPIYLIHHD